MKNTLIALITCATTSVGFGASAINASNFRLGNNADGRLIVDNSGSPIDSGSLGWAVGTFDSSFDFTSANTLTDDSAVLAAFTQSGSDGSFAPTANGAFNGQIADVDSDGSLAGQSGLFFVIGNNTDVSAATEVIVFRSSDAFPVQDGAGNGAGNYSVLFENGELVFGVERSADTSSLPAPFAGLNTGVTFNVPEPSTTFLSVLAGFGLIARRRRV